MVIPKSKVDYLRVTHPCATLLRIASNPFLVRLACVKHAASVHSEPGSNSPVIILFLLNSLKSCFRPALQIFTDQFSKIKKKLLKENQTRPREDRRIMHEKKTIVKRFLNKNKKIIQTVFLSLN